MNVKDTNDDSQFQCLSKDLVSFFSYKYILYIYIYIV